MPENFSVEIISPDKSILKMETPEVVIPSFEGEMGIYVSGGSTLIASLSKGTSFGEQAVVGTKHRMATAKAIEDSKCLEIPANMFTGYFHSKINSLIFVNG